MKHQVARSHLAATHMSRHIVFRDRLARIVLELTVNGDWEDRFRFLFASAEGASLNLVEIVTALRAVLEWSVHVYLILAAALRASGSGCVSHNSKRKLLREKAKRDGYRERRGRPPRFRRPPRRHRQAAISNEQERDLRGFRTCPGPETSPLQSLPSDYRGASPDRSES